MKELMQAALKDCKQLPEVKSAIMAQVAKRVDAPRFPLSPSQALKPMRDLYYSLLNYYTPGTIPQDALEPRVLLTFEHGYVVEEFVKKHVKNSYVVKHDQARVVISPPKDDFPGVAGNIDWCCVINGENVLVDSKSIGSFPFKVAPKEDNVAQMILYMASDWAKANNVKKAILIYFNKDNSDIKCVEVQKNDLLASQLIQRLQTVWSYYKSGTVPPREYVLGEDWQAQYSMYKTYDNAEFRIPVEKREVIKVEGSPLPLREHVLTYGNAVVEYDSETIFVKLVGDKLTLVNKESSQWEQVG